MHCQTTDLRNKEVINQCDGCRLGCVGDVEVDTSCGQVVSIIIYGRGRCFGLLGREEDICIPWADICVVGDDTVLVRYTPPCAPQPKQSRKQGHGFWGGFFR